MAYPGTYEAALSLLEGIGKGAKIVDLGCGRGFIVEELRKRGFRNIAYCDLVDNFDGKVVLMDFNRGLDFPDGSFDVAISTEVVEHLENKYQFFREVKRILKKDGIFIFSSPNLNNIFNRTVFLFKKRFIEFNAKEQPHHVNPFFLWQLPGFFSIEKTAFNRGFIPLVRLPMIRSMAFGQCMIVRCRVKKD
ncbi:class I SAM-dependent methyltransferase [Candidatus Woesearchaeota archaeon]|nr:class I SAM-dependent methyltransferase [Candidatus Woesearchaeota archaeon]